MQGAVAGLIAALAATTILFLIEVVRNCLAESQDVRYIRDLLINGKRRVMEAEDTFHEGMGKTIPADVLRAGQYNNMLKELGIALEKWTVNLSHGKRKDIFNALDWYNTKALPAIKRYGEVEFVDLPDGKWPTKQMSIENAKNKFEELQSIDWLKLESQ